jgi:TDG/mug DNA glycosylase family protein
VSAPPSRADLDAARDLTIPDVLPRPGDAFAVLFCGINPGLYSAATGWHFARPGNRFWPALHLSGFTERRLQPSEQQLLPGYGLGITNLVARATAQAAELTNAELAAGGQRLATLIAGYRPAIVAVAGVTAYRKAFGRPRASVGPQPEDIAGSRLWIVPNPSGLNAHWTLERIAAEFAAMRAAAGYPHRSDAHRRETPAEEKQYGSDNAGELVRGRRIYGRWDAAINAEYRCKTEVQALYSYTILPHCTDLPS